MAGAKVRQRYLDAGLRVLGEHGHAGLKLATVCTEAGTTTGSFYHAFGGWPAFTSALVAHWREERSGRLIAQARQVDDPRERLEVLTQIGLTLPHRSEAAIRVWAAHDPEVAEHQAAVDAERRDFLTESYATVVGRAEAERFATAAMLLLVGHESSTLASDEALAWGFELLREQALAQGPHVR